MLIGELSKKSGLSRDTIRFYEKRGLIVIPRGSRKANNYKDYPEFVLNRLNLIVKVKDLGFTLTEIETFFKCWGADDASCENLVYTLYDKVKQVDQQLAQLQQLKQRLRDSLLKCERSECEIESAIPASIGDY